MAKPLHKDLAEIRRLKKEGHDIIDRLVKIGVTKTEAYARIATKLGCSEKMAHFHARFTLRECKASVKALQQIEQDRIALIARKKEETRLERAARARAKREAARRPIPVPVPTPAPRSWFTRFIESLWKPTS